MKTTNATTQAARHASTRITALRAEIRETEKSTSPAKSTMLKALMKDLFEQECRLAANI